MLALIILIFYLIAGIDAFLGARWGTAKYSQFRRGVRVVKRQKSSPNLFA
jgi:hypothetical protein